MLKQKLILSYSSKIMMQPVQIIASIVVARVAGPTVLGTVAFGLAFVSLFEFVADLGLSTAHIKLVSEGEDLGKCISTYSMLKAATTSFFVIVVLGVYLIQKYVMNVQFESKSHEYVIIISLLFVTINNFLFIPRSTFAARAEQAKQDIPDIIRTLMHQIFRVVIVLLGYKAVALALGNLASLILITPFILFLFKDYPKDFFDKKLASKYVKLSLPILIMGMATTVVANLDRVILQYITNSEQVGYYTVSFRIGGLVRLIANSIGMLFFPLFSMASSKGDFFYIKDKIEKIERFSYVFIMPLVLFLAIYSDTIVHFLLGREYIPGIPALSILTVAMFVQILNMPYGNVVTGLGYFKLAAAVNLVNLFFFIISLVIFIHPKIFGLNATGAAISVLSSQIFLGILGRFYAKKKVDILDITKYMKFVYFGVINFILLFLFYTSFKDFWGMKSRLIFPVFYFLLTYLSLVVIKWIDKNDWQMLLSIVNIKAMKKYIDKEILRK